MVELAKFSKSKRPIEDCPNRALVDYWIQTANDRGYKPGWAVYRVLETPGVCLEDLKYLAKSLGYHHRWALHKWAELQGVA